ncbi:hypothetical protein [Hallerella succinigenes]|uniref:Uncharacterized protein n=1 Tax=Hallerella succinigenes TaxID=1896222 RepID=A0A2M9A687_9BACT|nr:hypothetical protein [Hallerella succinigenes]PJJ41234.1 hypothetical protein BGX16_1194 [Hallerella succinigenes]
MNLKKIIVAFFFAVSYNFSFGHEITSPQSTIDSAKIYYDLIAEENYQAYSRPNVIGMIAGGSLTVVGGALVGFGLYAILYNSNDPYENVAGNVLGSLSLLTSIPFLGVGIPVLSYNTYKYIVHKGHANKRDEYQAALDRYKLRKRGGESSALQLMIFPELNFIEKRGGVNAVVRF